MANWQRGVLYLRGSKENLRKFFLNLIDPDDLEAANVNENSIYLKTTSHIGFHIKDTCGNYIDSYEMNINFLDATIDENGNYIFSMDFASCCSIEVEELLSVANKYKIDIYIDVADAWGGYTHQLLIQCGIVTRNEINEL